MIATHLTRCLHDTQKAGSPTDPHRPSRTEIGFVVGREKIGRRRRPRQSENDHWFALSHTLVGLATACIWWANRFNGLAATTNARAARLINAQKND